MSVRHNYVAEPTEYPTAMKTQGYGDAEAYSKRFKKTTKEKAELWAMKKGFKKELKKEHGQNWKQALRTMGKINYLFDNSIVFGTKILAQWN